MLFLLLLYFFSFFYVFSTIAVNKDDQKTGKAEKVWIRTSEER